MPGREGILCNKIRIQTGAVPLNSVKLKQALLHKREFDPTVF